MDVDKNKIVLVMEYADLGTLMTLNENLTSYFYNHEILKFLFNEMGFSDVNIDDFIKESLTENVFLKNHKILIKFAKFLFKMLGDALKYLHDLDIAHRDIKPDNILLNSFDKNLKLIDFSISYKLKEKTEKISSDSGTWPFKAPESFEMLHNPLKADIFSFGATLFVFLFNRFNYNFDEEFEDVRLLKENYLELFELLRGMLEKDPEKRFSIDQVINHEFFIN
jgi:serine/threonine protein kinase